MQIKSSEHFGVKNSGARFAYHRVRDALLLVFALNYSRIFNPSNTSELLSNS